MTDFLHAAETQQVQPGSVVVNVGQDLWKTWANASNLSGALVGMVLIGGMPGTPITVITIGRFPATAFNLGAGNATTVAAGNTPSRSSLGTIIGTCDASGEIFLLGTSISTASSSEPIPSVPTFAALRLTAPNASNAVVLLGYSAINDGGGGVFEWGTVPVKDDGGTRANAGGLGSTTPGWSRVYSPYRLDVRWFGATGLGVVDDSNAIQLAINSSLNIGSQFIVLPPKISSFLGTYPEVYIPRGMYKLSAPAGSNIACLEVFGGIKIIGDRQGTVLSEITNSKHIFRSANFYNDFDGLTFVGGKAAIAFNGLSRASGGVANLGNVTNSANNTIRNCGFYYNGGPSLWLDSTSQNSGSSASVSVENCFFQTSCYFYGGFDGMRFSECYGFASQSAVTDTNAVPVLDDNNVLLPVFVNYGQLNLEHLTMIPQSDDTAVPRSSWVGGCGLIHADNTRFGGESQLQLGTGGTFYKYLGQTMGTMLATSSPLAVYPQWQFTECAIASTSNHNLFALYNNFPKLLDIRQPTLSISTGGSAPSPPLIASQSNGVYVDSATITPQSSFLGFSKESCVLNFEGFSIANPLKFRYGTNPLSMDGEDITAKLRKYFVPNAVSRQGRKSLGYAQNYWPAGKIGGTNADINNNVNVVNSAADTTTGYSIGGFTATADQAIINVDFDNVTNGLPAGIYTLSWAMKSNISESISPYTADILGGNASVFDTVPFTASSGVWQRYKSTFYHDGTSRGIGFIIRNLPLAGGSNPATAVIYIGLFALHKGEDIEDWTYPSNPTLQDAVRSTYRGSSASAPVSGTYIAGDVYLVDAPTQGNPWGFVCTVGGSPGTWVAMAQVGGFVPGADIAGNSTSTNTLQYVSALSFSSAAAGGTIPVNGTNTLLNFVTNAITLQQGGTTLVSLKQVAGDFISLGATAAGGGFLRVSNNAPIIKARNGTPSNPDVVALQVSSANIVQVGDSANGGGVSLYGGGTQLAQLGATGSDFINFGVAAAATGMTRFSKNTTIMAARNAAGTGDDVLISVDASDNVTFGSTNIVTTTLNAGGAGTINLSIGASVVLQCTSSGVTINQPIVTANQTTATSATAGVNGAVPAQVVGYWTVTINGTARKIPFFAL